MNQSQHSKDPNLSVPCGKLKIVLAMLLMGFTNVRADSSGNAGYGMIVLGIMGVIGTTIGCAGFGTYTVIEGAGTGVTIVVGVLVAMSGVTGSRMTSLLKKEVVMQLKVDHETYLAGGEKTPFLQEVYRQVQIATKSYSQIDPATGMESIDEEKITAAIDRMVEISELARTEMSESVPAAN